MRGYKDLFVWREAIAFVPDVYAIVNGFPAHERFGLCDQIRRAAVSIPANIAEGQARYSLLDFLRHLRIAKGSLAELHTHMIIAEQLGYIDPIRLGEIEQRISEIARPLHKLILNLRSRSNPETTNRRLDHRD